MSFLDRLIHISIPLIRDFRGFSPKSFDRNSNYNLGISEQIIFREIDYDKIDKFRGLNVTFVTTATDVKSSYMVVEIPRAPSHRAEFKITLYV